jgi:hypothetical protein
MNLRPRENIARLKKIASKKLAIKAKRVFLASGAEITDVDELQNNDTLYISQGEPFYKAVGEFFFFVCFLCFVDLFWFSHSKASYWSCM